MLKLKLQYFGHLMWRTDSLEKTLMLGNSEGRRNRRWQRMRWLDGCHHRLDGKDCEQALGVGDGQGSMCYSPWGHKASGMTEWLNWLKYMLNSTFLSQIRFFRGSYWEAVRGGRSSLGINIWSGEEAGQHRGCDAESPRDSWAVSWMPEPLYASSLSHWRRGLSWEGSDLEQGVSLYLK